MFELDVPPRSAGTVETNILFSTGKCVGLLKPKQATLFNAIFGILKLANFHVANAPLVSPVLTWPLIENIKLYSQSKAL